LHLIGYGRSVVRRMHLPTPLGAIAAGHDLEFCPLRPDGAMNKPGPAAVGGQVQLGLCEIEGIRLDGKHLRFGELRKKQRGCVAGIGAEINDLADASQVQYRCVFLCHEYLAEHDLVAALTQPEPDGMHKLLGA
jgi:hypothetical protein